MKAVRGTFAIAVISAALLQGCAAGSGPTEVASVAEVSVGQLLADPSAYEGRVVRARGHLVLEFEGDALWADRAAREARVRDRRIALAVDGLSYARKAALSERDAQITGVFRSGDCGHLGAARGGLEDIRLISVDGETLHMAVNTSPDRPKACFNF